MAVVTVDRLLLEMEAEIAVEDRVVDVGLIVMDSSVVTLVERLGETDEEVTIRKLIIMVKLVHM